MHSPQGSKRSVKDAKHEMLGNECDIYQSIKSDLSDEKRRVDV
jgi:hypothetical protein